MFLYDRATNRTSESLLKHFRIPDGIPKEPVYLDKNFPSMRVGEHRPVSLTHDAPPPGNLVLCLRLGKRPGRCSLGLVHEAFQLVYCPRWNFTTASSENIVPRSIQPSVARGLLLQKVTATLQHQNS
jgi:hypothetical protein